MSLFGNAVELSGNCPCTRYRALTEQAGTLPRTGACGLGPSEAPRGQLLADAEDNNVLEKAAAQALPHCGVGAIR